MIMISLMTNYPKICANAAIWSKIVKFCPIFSLVLFDPFSNFVKFCFLFLKNLSEVSKGFYPLIMSLSHFGGKLGIDFFRNVNWCFKGGIVENVETVSFMDSSRQGLQTLLHEMPLVRCLLQGFCSMMFDKK